MSRNREFDDAKVRDDIMGVFWSRGYEATNLSQLEAATGLVRTSLYNAFGNKADMFTVALGQYHAMMEGALAEAARAGGVRAILDAFEMMLASPRASRDRPAGCLMVGAATQSATLDEPRLALVRQYRTMLVTTLAAAIGDDQQLGRISAAVDPDGAAELLVYVMWGALAADCLGTTDRDRSQGFAALHRVLDGWAPRDPGRR
jgi:TetR/AcrR family transcriptional repressor of nem operon